MSLPDNHNTAIVIVTYNPDIIFTRAISVHKKIAETIIIVDNHSCNIQEWENTLSGCLLVKSHTNKGIGWALNTGIKKALELKKDYIITFDQDSIPVINILELYAQNTNDNTGLIGTWFTEQAKPSKRISIHKSLTVITSGCLHNLESV